MSATMFAGVAAAVLTLGVVADSGRTAGAASTPFPIQPVVRSSGGVASMTLVAQEAADHHAEMTYDGSTMLPVIRVWPGDHMRITYVNNLPAHTSEQCALGTCKDMTNLHFHGLEVSPNTPQDNVLTMLAMPGQTLQYDVHLPPSHMPGIFWIHTHPHEESAEQALDGMSLPIVVEGIDRYAPQVRGLRERVLMIRTLEGTTARDASLQRIESVPKTDCGSSGEPADDFPTLNGAIRPAIAIKPGERQFWRIVNAEPENFLDLYLDGSSFQVVALDGEPLALRDRSRPMVTMQHVFLPPAGRVEAIVTGPSVPHATLRTACVNTGPAGDINPAAVIADITPTASTEPPETVPASTQAPAYQSFDVTRIENAAPQFTLTFTEGHHRFYINNQLFHPWSKPMVTVRVGTLAHWHVINKTHEMHPFHIHQLHFLTYEINGKPVAHPVWLDTMNVLPEGSIDTVMDFTDPVIRGVAVFHCHILNHEDKGMMAKIVFK